MSRRVSFATLTTPPQNDPPLQDDGSQGLTAGQKHFMGTAQQLEKEFNRPRYGGVKKTSEKKDFQEKKSIQEKKASSSYESHPQQQGNPEKSFLEVTVGEDTRCGSS